MNIFNYEKSIIIYKLLFLLTVDSGVVTPASVPRNAYTGSSSTAQPDKNQAKNPWLWVGSCLGIIVLVAVVTIILIVKKRRRKRARKQCKSKCGCSVECSVNENSDSDPYIPGNNTIQLQQTTPLMPCACADEGKILI